LEIKQRESDMSNIIIVATLINALAVIVIAWYASTNYKLANKVHNLEKEMQKQNKEAREKQRQELGDLYQAITIATLLSGSSGTNVGLQEKAIELFNKHYTGDTRIFNDDSSNR